MARAASKLELAHRHVDRLGRQVAGLDHRYVGAREKLAQPLGMGGVVQHAGRRRAAPASAETSASSSSRRWPELAIIRCRPLARATSEMAWIMAA